MKLVYELKEETQRFSENSDLWYDYDNVGRVIQEDQYMPAWVRAARPGYCKRTEKCLKSASDRQNDITWVASMGACRTAGLQPANGKQSDNGF